MMRGRPNGDPSMPAPREHIGEKGRAISFPVADRVAQQARRDVGEIVGAIEVPIVAMQPAFLGPRRAAERGNAKQKTRVDRGSHVGFSLPGFGRGEAPELQWPMSKRSQYRRGYDHRSCSGALYARPEVRGSMPAPVSVSNSILPSAHRPPPGGFTRASFWRTCAKPPRFVHRRASLAGDIAAAC